MKSWISFYLSLHTDSSFSSSLTVENKFILSFLLQLKTSSFLLHLQLKTSSFYLSFSVLGVSGCTLTLTLIACDRFFGIIFAMRAHLTERKASVFVFLIWSISVVLSLPMLIFNERKYRHWSDFVEVWCHMKFPGESGSKAASIWL